MGAIFQVNEHDVPWMEYAESAGDDGRAQIRVKPLTMHDPEIPPVQYVEYAAGHTDPMHHHKTDEFFIVVEGELVLEGVANGPSVVFIPRDTEYAVRGGDEGARYFLVVR